MTNSKDELNRIIDEELAAAREDLPPLPPVRPLSDAEREAWQKHLRAHEEIVRHVQAWRRRALEAASGRPVDAPA